MMVPSPKCPGVPVCGRTGDPCRPWQAAEALLRHERARQIRVNAKCIRPHLAAYAAAKWRPADPLDVWRGSVVVYQRLSYNAQNRSFA